MTLKKTLVVLSGAGVSQESGLKTFRDEGGLWEGHDVMEVASIQGWNKNPQLVLEFYNQRRKQAISAKPNQAHKIIAALEEDFNVRVVTQNVDSLHEEAGSSNVTHLHGKLFESRSTKDESLVYQMKGWELKQGDLCEKGSQLRPNIVWFGEMVPMMDKAMAIMPQADYLIVVGTSLLVYPAAGLVNFVKPNIPIAVVDPNLSGIDIPSSNVKFYQEKASSGMEKLSADLRFWKELEEE